MLALYPKKWYIIIVNQYKIHIMKKKNKRNCYVLSAENNDYVHLLWETHIIVAPVVLAIIVPIAVLIPPARTAWVALLIMAGLMGLAAVLAPIIAKRRMRQRLMKLSDDQKDQLLLQAVRKGRLGDAELFVSLGANPEAEIEEYLFYDSETPSIIRPYEEARTPEMKKILKRA